MRFLLFILLAVAHADPSVTVWSRSPNAVRKYFPADKYRMLDSDDEKKQFEETGWLNPIARDALFNKLGFDLQQLDEMDKDMLVMGARFETLPSLKKHYPMLKEEQIKALMKELAQK